LDLSPRRVQRVGSSRFPPSNPLRFVVLLDTVTHSRSSDPRVPVMKSSEVMASPLEVVAEAEITRIRKRVVPGGVADILQVIVLCRRERQRCAVAARE